MSVSVVSKTRVKISKCVNLSVTMVSLITAKHRKYVNVCVTMVSTITAKHRKLAMFQVYIGVIHEVTEIFIFVVFVKSKVGWTSFQQAARSAAQHGPPMSNLRGLYENNEDENLRR